MDNHTSSTRSSIVSINNLTRRYKEKTAVENLNLSIAENQIFGLIGPNGAGKTTTVRMLTSLIAPTAGTAVVTDWLWRSCLHKFLSANCSNLELANQRPL